MNKEHNNNSTIAFCLFRYFPYGGLQRDFLRIAKLCQAAGFGIRVYTMRWDGDIPDGFDVRIVETGGFSNHSRALNFSRKVCKLLESEPMAVVAGFNKMAGLDVYFAADTCFAKKYESKGKLRRMLPRARTFLRLEREVFSVNSKTFVMLIAQQQQADFTQYYQLAPDRFTLLPCGAADKFFLPEQIVGESKLLRDEYGIAEDDFLIVQVASYFNGKGVDRAIIAIASLPIEKRRRCTFIVAGGDKPAKMMDLAKKLQVERNVKFVGSRDDVDRFYRAADLLLHPARVENTGTTIVEALAANLPVVCSAACGYSQIVLDCKAGMITDEPFDQSQLNSSLDKILDKQLLAQLSSNAKIYGTNEKLSGLDTAAAKIIMDHAKKVDINE